MERRGRGVCSYRAYMVIPWVYMQCLCVAVLLLSFQGVRLGTEDDGGRCPAFVSFVSTSVAIVTEIAFALVKGF